MKLIVGLGNPGKQYEDTRHNMGYKAVDAFADMANVIFDRDKFNGTYGVCKNSPDFKEDFILAKPTTFMNNSGEFVRPFAEYFGIETEDILIVFDDMALKPGVIRLRQEGSSGGQKGMQNIIDQMKTQKIKRIRIGIGEPPFSGVDWVLGKAKGEEADLLEGAVTKASKAIRDYLLHGFLYAMDHYN